MSPCSHDNLPDQLNYHFHYSNDCTDHLTILLYNLLTWLEWDQFLFLGGPSTFFAYFSLSSFFCLVMWNDVSKDRNSDNRTLKNGLIFEST